MTTLGGKSQNARPIHTMVLCAGFGQRLRPLTDELPKPLLPLGDRPVLGHIAARLHAAGRLEAIANTHWLPDKFININESLQITLNLVHEPEIRGVAGAVAGVRDRLEAPVLVWSGDILIDAPPLDALTASATASGDLCLAVAPTRGPGTVGLDAAGRVVRVRGEVHGIEVRAADYVSLFAAGAQSLRELPERGCLIGDYCLPRMRAGRPIDTVEVAGRWWDVGTPASYLAANRDWLARSPEVRNGSYVSPSALLEPGVVLESSIVGAGARIAAGVTLRSCVVWPGSVVGASLSNCVVTPRAIVPVGVSGSA
jgi:mannose-1-phosphate guanylyltransferase